MNPSIPEIQHIFVLSGFKLNSPKFPNLNSLFKNNIINNDVGLGGKSTTEEHDG